MSTYDSDQVSAVQSAASTETASTTDLNADPVTAYFGSNKEQRLGFGTLDGSERLGRTDDPIGSQTQTTSADSLVSTPKLDVTAFLSTTGSSTSVSTPASITDAVDTVSAHGSTTGTKTAVGNTITTVDSTIAAGIGSPRISIPHIVGGGTESTETSSVTAEDSIAATFDGETTTSTASGRTGTGRQKETANVSTTGSTTYPASVIAQAVTTADPDVTTSGTQALSSTETSVTEPTISATGTVSAPVTASASTNTSAGTPSPITAVGLDGAGDTSTTGASSTGAATATSNPSANKLTASVEIEAATTSSQTAPSVASATQTTEQTASASTTTAGGESETTSTADIGTTGGTVSVSGGQALLDVLAEVGVGIAEVKTSTPATSSTIPATPLTATSAPITTDPFTGQTTGSPGTSMALVLVADTDTSTVDEATVLAIAPSSIDIDPITLSTSTVETTLISSNTTAVDPQTLVHRPQSVATMDVSTLMGSADTETIATTDGLAAGIVTTQTSDPATLTIPGLELTTVSMAPIPVVAMTEAIDTDSTVESTASTQSASTSLLVDASLVSGEAPAIETNPVTTSSDGTRVDASAAPVVVYPRIGVTVVPTDVPVVTLESDPWTETSTTEVPTSASTTPNGVTADLTAVGKRTVASGITFMGSDGAITRTRTDGRATTSGVVTTFDTSEQTATTDESGILDAGAQPIAGRARVSAIGAHPTATVTTTITEPVTATSTTQSVTESAISARQPTLRLTGLGAVTTTGAGGRMADGVTTTTDPVTPSPSDVSVTTTIPQTSTTESPSRTGTSGASVDATADLIGASGQASAQSTSAMIEPTASTTDTCGPTAVASTTTTTNPDTRVWDGTTEGSVSQSGSATAHIATTPVQNASGTTTMATSTPSTATTGGATVEATGDAVMAGATTTKRDHVDTTPGFSTSRTPIVQADTTSDITTGPGYPKPLVATAETTTTSVDTVHKTESSPVEPTVSLTMNGDRPSAYTSANTIDPVTTTLDDSTIQQGSTTVWTLDPLTTTDDGLVTPSTASETSTSTTIGADVAVTDSSTTTTSSQPQTSTTATPEPTAQTAASRSATTEITTDLDVSVSGMVVSVTDPFSESFSIGQTIQTDLTVMQVTPRTSSTDGLLTTISSTVYQPTIGLHTGGALTTEVQILPTEDLEVKAAWIAASATASPTPIGARRGLPERMRTVLLELAEETTIGAGSTANSKMASGVIVESTTDDRTLVFDTQIRELEVDTDHRYFEHTTDVE